MRRACRITRQFHPGVGTQVELRGTDQRQQLIAADPHEPVQPVLVGEPDDVVGVIGELDFDDRQNNRLLIRKIPEQGARADPGGGTDFFRASALETFFGKDAGCATQDFSPTQRIEFGIFFARHN